MVDFLVIGNVVAAHYDEVFPLMMDERVFLGYSISSGYRYFQVPDDYEFYGTVCKEEEGKRYIAVSGVRWFTNMRDDYPPELILSRKYIEGEYKKFDNNDILFIEKTKDIPYDYDGVMGVPITFLDKWCRRQFEILGLKEDGVVDGERRYTRLLIRRKKDG